MNASATVRLVCAVAAAVALLGPRTTSAQDWPQWRGPQRDGHVPAVEVPETWPPQLERMWRVEVGEGHAGPVIVGDRVYVHTRLDDLETVSCLSLKTGDLLWRRTNPAPYVMNGAARGHGKGPKSTPVVADGRLFTLGITGILSCYHTVTAPQPAADGGHRPPVPNAGDLMWRWSARDRFPVSAPLYGTATSPIVVGDQVIAHLGGAGEGALVARAVADGGERWRWDQDGPGYASPVVVDVDGVPQLVTQTEKLCLAVDPTSGRELWRLPFTTPYDQNIVTPVALGPGLVAFSGLEQGTRAVQLGSPGPDGTPQTLWHNPGDWLYMSSPLVSGTRLFGLTRRDRGRLFCLDTASGEAIWKSPGGQGDNVVFLDLGGALLLLTTEARLIVLDPAAAAFEPLAEYRVADSATWAHPAVTADRLLIKDASHLTSWRLPVADADAPTSVTP